MQTTYPLSLDDEKTEIKNFKFMSREHLDALSFTAEKAKELGLRMDLTLGSGWPYGGPQFPISEAAGRLRTVKNDITEGQTSVALPKISEGEKVFAAFIGPVQKIQSGDNPFKEVEILENAVQIPADLKGRNQITFFIASQTKMKVKRAAYGAEGYVIDHYSPAVIDKFIKEIAEPAVKACGPNPPYAVFCDSLESAGEDWTYNFLDEFQRRRGYDLKPYLPALFHDIGPKTADIRHDWGKTLTEIFNDYFVSDLRNGRNTTGRNSAYRLTALRPRRFTVTPMPTLAKARATPGRVSAKPAGRRRPITCWDARLRVPKPGPGCIRPFFGRRPLDMKAEANLHFLQGINQLIGHGWPYSPPEVEYPGWRFYASVVFDEKQSLVDRHARCGKISAARQLHDAPGPPANDVALYLADSDAWASFVPGPGGHE